MGIGKNQPKAPAKRSQHANATYSSIVGRNMLCAFGDRVATCWALLAQNLKIVKFEPTTPNTSQHGGRTHATCCAHEYRVDMLRKFGRGLISDDVLCFPLLSLIKYIYQCFYGTDHTTAKEFENAALFPRSGQPSTLIRHANPALVPRSGQPSTLIRHANEALFPRSGQASTLIRHANAALVPRSGQPSTLIRHANQALFPRSGQASTLIRHANEAFLHCSSNRRNLKTLSLCITVWTENKAFM